MLNFLKRIQLWMGHDNLFSKTRKTLSGNPHKIFAKAVEAPLPPLPSKSLPERCLAEAYRRRRCPVFIDLPVRLSFLKRYCHGREPSFFQRTKLIRYFLFDSLQFYKVLLKQMFTFPLCQVCARVSFRGKGYNLTNQGRFSSRSCRRIIFPEIVFGSSSV